MIESQKYVAAIQDNKSSSQEVGSIASSSSDQPNKQDAYALDAYAFLDKSLNESDYTALEDIIAGCFKEESGNKTAKNAAQSNEPPSSSFNIAAVLSLPKGKGSAR